MNAEADNAMIETVDVPQTVTAMAPGTTPMAQRVAVLGLLNKRNGISREFAAAAGAGGADRRRDRAPARLRDDGALGGAAADRRLRPARRAQSPGPVPARLLGLALQGNAQPERRRAPDLRCLAQELRDDPSRRRRAGGAAVEQPVQRGEFDRAGAGTGAGPGPAPAPEPPAAAPAEPPPSADANSAR